MKNPKKHIAVNARFLISDQLEGIGRFSYEVLKRMVRENPEVHFSFFFDRPYNPDFIFGENVTPYVLFPPARHPFLFILFFEYAVKRKLDRLKPDLFFSPDGYLSLRSKIPQVGVIHDLAFEHFPHYVKKLEAWHYKRYFPRYAKKAAHILTVSNYTKQDIIKLYGVNEEQITVVYNGCSSAFGPLGPQAQQEVRNRFTGGKPYFHYVGSIHPRKNLANLIAGFNIFKKQTSSPAKLVIVGRKAWDFEKVIHTYEQSEWKEEIIFTGFVDDKTLNELYSASIALCYVPEFEGFGIPPLEAMYAETGIIASNVSSIPEVTGDAAILTDPYNPAEIADAMTKLFSSETERTSLIHKGQAQRAQFTWEATYRKTWNIIQKA